MEKIRLAIGGEFYNISTDDDLEYVEQIGRELDGKIRDLMNSSGRVSVTQAAVLTALEYVDSYRKSERDCENLRTQLQAYLEDAARSRTDAELAKREAAALRKELDALNGAK